MPGFSRMLGAARRKMLGADTAGNPGETLAGTVALIRGDSLFDDGYYADLAGVDPARADLVEDYVTRGERLGLRPFPGFDPAFYAASYPDIAATGRCLLAHYIRYGRGENRAAVHPREAPADRIRASGIFDGEYYAREAGIVGKGVDPVAHYLEVGESFSISPSPTFDPGYYRQTNPDAASSGMVLLLHFLEHGKAEGRAACRPLNRLVFPAPPADGRPVILVLVHQASRTGAPILGWNIVQRLQKRYRVVTVCLSDGEILASFRTACDTLVEPVGFTHSDTAEDYAEFARRLIEAYRPAFAIANSAETRLLATPLASAGLPCTGLVHEFAQYYTAESKVDQFFRAMSRLVFPARLLAEAAEEIVPDLDLRRIVILPQGRCHLPVEDGHGDTAAKDRLQEQLRPPGMEDAFLVVGLGTVEARKGIDLFVSAAVACRRLAGERPIRFVWFGKRFENFHTNQFNIMLDEQVKRSGLGDRFAFAEPVADLGPVYAAADVLFLSSRLDPLPNVSIDAACEGKPVICFDRGSGMAEILKKDPATSDLVVAYMDVGNSAEQIVRLMREPAQYRAVSTALAARAATLFDMDRYVAALEAICLDAVQEAGRAPLVAQAEAQYG